MKHLFLSILLTVSCFIGTSFAATKKTQLIPIEVSSLLMSPEYSKIISEQEMIAMNEGKRLKVTSFEVVKMGSVTYAYLFLSSRSASDFGSKWNPAGTIAANITYRQLGEVITDGVFFKPQEEGPGGASVSNN